MADKINETYETYDPSTVEVDRAREQGLGMGERDLQRQRDPGDRSGSDARSTGLDADDEEDTGDGFGRAEPVT